MVLERMGDVSSDGCVQCGTCQLLLVGGVIEEWNGDELDADSEASGACDDG